jgi:hypothetical protein
VFPGSRNLVVDGSCASPPAVRLACTAVASFALTTVHPVATVPEDVTSARVTAGRDRRVRYAARLDVDRTTLSTFDSIVENLRVAGVRSCTCDRVRLTGTLRGKANDHDVTVRVTVRPGKDGRALATVDIATVQPV